MVLCEASPQSDVGFGRSESFEVTAQYSRRTSVFQEEAHGSISLTDFSESMIGLRGPGDVVLCRRKTEIVRCATSCETDCSAFLSETPLQAQHEGVVA